jgi:hypothetical protein
MGNQPLGLPDRSHDAVPDIVFQIWQENQREESLCDWLDRPLEALQIMYQYVGRIYWLDIVA